VRYSRIADGLLWTFLWRTTDKTLVAEPAVVRAARVRQGLTAAAVLLVLLALAGTAVREWPQLHQQGSLAKLLGGPGDYAPVEIIAALFHGQSVAAAYLHSHQPYPLPYLLAFAPFGMLDEPWLRVAVTLFSIAFVLVAVWLVAGESPNPGLLPALISVPVVATLLSPHITSTLGLLGVCLAAWAQPRRNWALMGVGLAIAFVRPPNALPLLAVLVYSSWDQPLGLLKAIAAGAVAILPFLAWAFWLDPGWIATYSANIAHTDYAGLPSLAINLGGTWGVILLQVAAVLGALLLARSQRGKPLHPDLAAIAIAIGVLSSKLAGPYSGLYALPALARLGLRPRLAWTPWIASGLGWLMEISFLPTMLAGAGGPPEWESVVAYGFVLAAWPLARRAGPVVAVRAVSSSA
jgi:hypothetical protein